MYATSSLITVFFFCVCVAATWSPVWTDNLPATSAAFEPSLPNVAVVYSYGYYGVLNVTTGKVL